MGRRIVEVGLSRKPLTPEEAEELLTRFEEWLVRALRRRLGRRLEELDLLVEGVLGEDGSFSVRVELRAAGRLIAPFSYDEVLAEAIEEAARRLEAELRSRVGGSEG